MKIFVKVGVLVTLVATLFFTTKSLEVDAAEQDPFANYMKMSDYASVHKYRVINKTLYFRANGESGRFARKMNPMRINRYVNSQIYNATVNLLDKKHYVNTTYRPADDGLLSRVLISYSPSEAYAMSGSTAFDYLFFDQKAFKHNSFLALYVNGLWYMDVSEINKDHAEAHYKSKLQTSIKAIFEKKEEDAIFKFVFDEYLRNAKGLTKEGTIKKKKIGNINIVMEKNTVCSFYFSYVKKP